MKPLNEVIEEEKAELRKKWPPFEVEGDHEQYSEGIFVSDIESLEDHLTQAMKKAALAVLQEVHDEIPEAYGWGPEDTEADRGYRICSKNVKAEINRRIATLHGQLTKSKND